MNYEEILYCITNAVRIYAIYKFFHIFFDKFLLGRVGEWIAYVVYFVLNSAIYLKFKTPEIMAITTFSLMIGISVLYKTKVLQMRLLIPALGIILNVCAEIVVSLLLEPQWMIFRSQNEMMSELSYVIISLLFYFFVVAIEKLDFMKSGNRVPTLFWIEMMVLIVMSNVLLIAIYVTHISRQLTLVSTVAILVFDIIAMMLYDSVMNYMNKQVDIARMIEQNHSYENQMRLLEENVRQTRILRHDLKNHIGILYRLVGEGKIADAEEYMEKMIKGIQIEKQYVNTGNPKIDAVINYKCAQAENEKIPLELEVTLAADLNMETKDFMTIFGNLMDNAIEAQSTLSKDKKISISLKSISSNLFLRVENPYEHGVIKKNGRMQTTKEDKMNHGIGMQSVRAVVNRYEGSMDYNYEKNVFIVDVMLIL